MFAYKDNGFSMRGVEENYSPIGDEILFDHYPTEEELRIAFPGREAAQEEFQNATLAQTARFERDRQLREIYDRGTQMVRRELEMTEDSIYIDKLKNKLLELHQYAVLLQNVPEQAAFPKTISWPEIPSGELE